MRKKPARTELCIYNGNMLLFLIAILLTKFSHAGITLDSFLSHGSQAVVAPNVILLLISTYPKVVAYSNQIVLNGTEDIKVLQPARIFKELNKLL